GVGVVSTQDRVAAVARPARGVLAAHRVHHVAPETVLDVFAVPRLVGALLLGVRELIGVAHAVAHRVVGQDRVAGEAEHAPAHQFAAERKLTSARVRTATAAGRTPARIAAGPVAAAATRGGAAGRRVELSLLDPEDLIAPEAEHAERCGPQQHGHDVVWTRPITERHQKLPRKTN